jgi:hypothetical protein
MGNALRLQNLLGSHAKRANGGGVHLDGGHGDLSVFVVIELLVFCFGA